MHLHTVTLAGGDIPGRLSRLSRIVGAAAPGLHSRSRLFIHHNLPRACRPETPGRPKSDPGRSSGIRVVAQCPSDLELLHRGSCRSRRHFPLRPRNRVRHDHRAQSRRLDRDLPRPSPSGQDRKPESSPSRISIPVLGQLSKHIANQSEATFVSRGYGRLVHATINQTARNEPSAAIFLPTLVQALPVAMHRSSVSLLADRTPTFREQLLRLAGNDADHVRCWRTWPRSDGAG